ncbi:MAG: hypothetical protein U0R19_41070 [Bryobacteraceae bacterium]
MKQTVLLLFLIPATFAADRFRSDDPLEDELKPLPVNQPARRKLSDYYDAVLHTVSTPGELNRKLRQPVRAQGVNTLGEPLQGAWWTKRNYYRRMNLEEMIAGPGNQHPPSQESKWMVVGAKSEGITPGFVMVDGDKNLYFIKFDPMSNPEMATGADHIAIRLVHALGYHVPENYLVEFREDILALSKDVQIADRLGRRRPMTRRDLSEMLGKVPRTKEGLLRATASRAIAGKGLGPYRYYGRRKDDPNDFIAHEHRRDLRGLAVVSAWIDHDDSRAINTYDALVEADGGSFIRHYILDLGSTLGSGTQKANSARSGGEYLFGWKQSAVQLFSLGLAVPRWARADFPNLPAVGRFEYEVFDPEKWVPEYPNPAFLNRLPDDEFWAAKQIMAIGDEAIRAIVRSANYSDPAASEWITRCLIERREKIGRAYFGKLLPLDRFRMEGERLQFEDLAETAGFGSAGPYSTEWKEEGSYRVAHISSQSRPGQFVEVAVQAGRVVGIDRHW